MAGEAIEREAMAYDVLVVGPARPGLPPPSA
jgi:hypothetical protein